MINIGKCSSITLKCSLEKPREKLLILPSEQPLGCRHRGAVRGRKVLNLFLQHWSLGVNRSKMVCNDAVMKEPMRGHKHKRAPEISPL